jgi:hypothetical protein
MYFDVTGGSAADAVAAVRQFWFAISGQLSTSVTANVSGVVDTIDPVTGDLTGSEATTAPASVTGSQASAPLPIEVQALVTWETGVVADGRRQRGRTFVPGLTEDTNSDGVAPSSATRTVLDLAAAALVADANSVLLLWRRAAGSQSPITSGATRLKWSYLRSRRD